MHCRFTVEAKMSYKRETMEKILHPQKPGLFKSLFIFGSISLLLILETRFLIPWLSRQTGLEPVVFWFIVAGPGLFFPSAALVPDIPQSGGTKIRQTNLETKIAIQRQYRYSSISKTNAATSIKRNEHDKNQ
jgi:hypothetical protein